MIRRHSLLISILTVLIVGLTGCVNQELTQVQSEVSDLHSRIYQMQRSSERQTSTTTTGLRQVSKEISDAFDEIRFKQSGLEEKVDQLSNRLLNAEEQLETLQTGLAQLDSRVGQGNQALREDIAGQKRERESALQSQKAEIDALRKEIGDVSERQQRDNAAMGQSVQTLQADLQKRLNALDAEVQSVYRDILKELGAATTPSTSTPASYSGDEYIVGPGDTLGGIARTVGVSAQALQEANGITDPNMIRVGQHLKVPK
ncbi:MAG: LysM peptidoglycan-binding domain-containing protein [bacterium]